MKDAVAQECVAQWNELRAQIKVPLAARTEDALRILTLERGWKAALCHDEAKHGPRSAWIKRTMWWSLRARLRGLRESSHPRPLA